MFSILSCCEKLAKELYVIGRAFKMSITKTRLFKYIENFTTIKGKFSVKKICIFHISAQNIDCGYSLEPPRRGGANE